MSSRGAHILRLLLPVWLVIAPAMASAHATDHSFSLTPDQHACALCQAGDRDDDAVVPEFSVLLAPPRAELVQPTAPRPAEGRTEGEKPIRGPPAAG
ncbi:hypothetical protein [Parvularcula lutaonensis]|uniref:DUF2946 domain-containing protein n=1 Tax=Parvularcula lutaonensis TaxID=491923 RepID=A0ABV7M9G7_9PROT|nr:hypothetical protein [Parvularcula lutaonensis]